MKPYGLPRHPGVNHPDVVDVQEFGLQTSAGRVHGSKTAQHSYTRKADNRNTIRRRWKKKERLSCKRQIARAIEDNENEQTDTRLYPS